MLKCKIEKRFFYIFLFFYIAASAILMFATPFTQAEANLIFNNNFTLTNLIINFLYPQIDNNLIRLPFFVLSLISLLIFYKIIKSYFKKEEFIYLTLFVYLLTPGLFLSFIIVNYATIPILLTLIFIFAYKKDYKILQIVVLVLLFFTHTAQFAFYIAILLYSFKKREWHLFITSGLMFLLSSVEATYPIDGIPRGHLLELFGIYGAVFSPLLFIAFVYSIYKIGLKGKKDILWYIAATVFSISILLSIRQKIRVTDFTPYIVIATPLIIQVYKDSISIRLKKFRKFYYTICLTIITVLLLETSLIIFHYPIYKFLHIDLWLIDKSIYKIEKNALILKKEGKNCINKVRKRDINLYRFYNISKCKQ